VTAMVTNYNRFWAAFNGLPHGDSESEKEALVSSFTGGRTTSLKEMTQKEYDAMCSSLESVTGWKEQLRKKRSLCLKLMQKAGVDTTDWQRINDFCRNPKISGRVFAQLGVKDLDALQVKLRAIMSKGGLRPSKAQGAATESHGMRREASYIVLPLAGMGQA